MGLVIKAGDVLVFFCMVIDEKSSITHIRSEGECRCLICACKVNDGAEIARLIREVNASLGNSVCFRVVTKPIVDTRVLRQEEL